MGASLLQGKDLGDAVGQFTGCSMTLVQCSQNRDANFGFKPARGGHKQGPVVGSRALDMGS